MTYLTRRPPPLSASRAPKSRVPIDALPAEPGFADLAKAYLEGEGYTVARKTPDKSFTGFLRAVRDRDQRVLEKVYQSEYRSDASASVRKVAMGETSGAIGGFLVPLDYSLAIFSVIAEESFVYPRAHVIPMRSAEMLLPQIDNETVPAAAGVSPFFGGLIFRWGNEQSPAQTEPAFRQLSLKAWDLLGRATTSNQLLMDMGSEGEEALVRIFGQAAAWYLEYAMFRGTGTPTQMPLGILNAPAALNVNRGVALTISTVDVANMASRILPFCWKHGIWACSPSCIAQLGKLPNFFLNTGTPCEDGHAGTLWTRPVFVTEKLPPLGTRGDIVFFDPSLYVLGIRQEVLVDVSPHSAFRNFQTDFRVWLRADGKPQLSDTITLQDQATTVSSIVVLN
jgi:HK97 family phage major capsid protein